MNQPTMQLDSAHMPQRGNVFCCLIGSFWAFCQLKWSHLQIHQLVAFWMAMHPWQRNMTSPPQSVTVMQFEPDRVSTDPNKLGLVTHPLP